MEEASYVLAPEDGTRLAWLHAHGEVLAREDGEDAVRLTVRLGAADRARFERGLQDSPDRDAIDA
jgi:GTPase